MDIYDLTEQVQRIENALSDLIDVIVGNDNTTVEQAKELFKIQNALLGISDKS